MAEAQERVQIDPSTGQPKLDANGQPIKRSVEFAMVQDIVTAYQLIARHATQGKNMDAFLRMMHDAHKMLQPEKDEAGEGRTPIRAQFVTAPSPPEPEPEGDQVGSPTLTATPQTRPEGRGWSPSSAPSGAIMTRDGKVYE